MSVITVDGIIDKKELGITLPHEHLFIDSVPLTSSSNNTKKSRISNHKVSIENLGILRQNPFAIEDNLSLSDEDLAVKELLEFKKSGGSTIVDVTTIGGGRIPAAIKRVSKKTAIEIIMGCGYYLKEALPEPILKETESNLIKKMINEVYYGAGKTNIRAGVIGEIGIGPEIGDWEKKILRISSKVQIETGLAIYVHIQAVPAVPGFSGELKGIEVLKILEKEGANLDKVVICHVDAKIDLVYIKNIIKSGAYVEFDHFGEEFYIDASDFLMDRDIDRVTAIKELIDLGHTNKILISQDICLKIDLVSYGGWGYSHILKNIVPMMLKRGIGREDIDTIMINNPMKLLDIDEKYL